MTVEELINKLKEYPPYYEVSDVEYVDRNDNGYVYFLSKYAFLPNQDNDDVSDED